MSRKNLLICRAGPSSLHPAWLRSGREFDLALSCYGKVPEGFGEEAVYYEHVAGFKWPPIADLLRREWSFVSRYEYVGFPDDDLAATASIWNALFNVGRELGLHLFQPALGPGSYLNWPWVAQDTTCRARIVRAVEVMTPIFRIDALEKLMDTFSLSQSGWGIDGVWAARLPHPQYRLAVIDEFPVVHTRPGGTGSLYDSYRQAGVSPMGDLNHLLSSGKALRPDDYVLYERIPLATDRDGDASPPPRPPAAMPASRQAVVRELIRSASPEELRGKNFLISLVCNLGLQDFGPDRIWSPKFAPMRLARGILQDPEQMAELLLELSRHPISSLVEIGTLHGDSILLLHNYLKRLNPQLQSVTIDPGSSLDPGFPQDDPSLTFVRGDRQSAAGRQVDLCFIDGDHNYDSVRADWEQVGRHAKICVFHDIVDRYQPDVRRFWGELHGGRTCKQILGNDGNMGYGIVFNGA